MYLSPQTAIERIELLTAIKNYDLVGGYDQDRDIFTIVLLQRKTIKSEKE